MCSWLVLLMWVVFLSLIGIVLKNCFRMNIIVGVMICGRIRF